jgi:glycosyltransferase involved in cell wall biosynthesis
VRIRVLHVCDKFGVSGSSIHGVSRLLLWWFPRFDPARFDVRLAGLRPADGASETLRRQGLDPDCLGKGRFSPSTLPALAARVRRFRPHVLHLHGYGATTFGRVVGALLGVPAVVHEHAVFPRVPAVQKPFDRALAGWTAHGLAVSESVKEFMVRRRYFPEEKVEVLLNGAPIEAFQPLAPAAAEEERRRWGIPPGCPAIGAVGRLDEQKGNRYLLEAAARIAGNGAGGGRDFRLVLVGDGPLMAEHRAQARRLGLDGKVIFTGYREDVPRLQSMLDVQVFPSLWEGVPLTAFEAMAMGRAIVATHVDGLAEVLRDGENALLVPPREPAPLADAVEALLADPARARRLAARAREDSRRFDVQRAVDRLQEIYQRLAGPPA